MLVIPCFLCYIYPLLQYHKTTGYSMSLSPFVWQHVGFELHTRFQSIFKLFAPRGSDGGRLAFASWLPCCGSLMVSVSSPNLSNSGGVKFAPQNICLLLN